MVKAALSGAIDPASLRTDAIFGLGVPTAVPGVPSEVLNPRATWPDGEAYDQQAKKLAGMFRANFARFGETAEEIREAGPKG
jgi:phosphoenolpyruvate carboxykinase (ATP)